MWTRKYLCCQKLPVLAEGPEPAVAARCRPDGVFLTLTLGGFSSCVARGSAVSLATFPSQNGFSIRNYISRGPTTKDGEFSCSCSIFFLFEELLYSNVKLQIHIKIKRVRNETEVKSSAFV